MRAWRRAVWLALAACAGGCGDDGSAGADAGPVGGADAGGVDGGSAPVPAAPAAPADVEGPQATPCPDGWSVVTSEGGEQACDPWPEGPADCAPGEARHPGDPACRAVGAACPAGDFPDDAGVSAIYVRAGATGGDGTRALPFARVTDAFAAAGPGSVVVVAAGRYDEALTLPANVTLRGACPARTVLTSSTPRAEWANVVAGGAGSALRDLTIADSGGMGIVVVGAAASLALDGVIVEHTEMLGILVQSGAHLVARDVVVRDVVARDGMLGYGLAVDRGGDADVRGASITGNTGMSVLVEASRLSLQDAAVRGTQPELDGGLGRGVSVNGASEVDVARVVIEQNREFGLVITPGADVALDHVVVRDTAPRMSDSVGGEGILVEGAHLDAIGLLVERNRDAGIMVSASGTLALADSLVRDTGSRPDGTWGIGLHVQIGSTAEVMRTVLERNHEVGCTVVAGSTARLADVVIRSTDGAEGDGWFGRALHADLDTTVEVTRGRFEGNRDVGVLARGNTTRLTLTDVVVRDTREQTADGRMGRGIVAQEGASLTATRALVEGNREVGVHLLAGTNSIIDDLVVRGTRSTLADGRSGRGIEIGGAAGLVARRVHVEDDRDVGVLIGVGSSGVTFEDLVVTGTLPEECAGAGGCPPGGSALVVVGGASAEVTRFALARSSLCGALVGDRGGLDLHGGVVSENVVGACVLVPDYDLGRLSDGVVYRDNERPLDTAELPLPEPTPAVPGAR